MPTDDDFHYPPQKESKGFVGAMNKMAKFLLGLDLTFDHFEKEWFKRDWERFNDFISPLIYPMWRYYNGTLEVIGIATADFLSDDALQGIFDIFEEGVSLIMQRYAGRQNGASRGIYATLFFMFNRMEDAQRIEKMKQKFYKGHFTKQTYTSSVFVDMEKLIFRRGKGALGTQWNGGLDIDKLERDFIEAEAYFL